MVFVCFFAMASCSTIPPDPSVFDSSYLVGAVYGGNSQGVHQVKLIIDGSTSVVSDINGRFTFESISKGVHVLKATKDGYETTEFEFDFQSRTQVVFFVVYSKEDYLEAAIKKMGKNDYVGCKELIQKIYLIDSLYVQARFLEAILYYKLNEFDQSYQMLQSLMNDGFNKIAIYSLQLDLALADTNLTQKIYDDISTNVEIKNVPLLKDGLKRVSSLLTKTNEKGEVDEKE